MKTLNIVTFAALAFGQSTVLAQGPAAVKDSSSVFASAMVELNAQGDTIRPPADFVAVEKEPVIIYKKEPVYPELAKKAGMEGIVWVKVWVGADGKPHQVVVLQSTADVFNQAAVDAAWAFRFEPALSHGKAVDVWVSFPFNFAMAQGDTPNKEFPQSYNSMRDFTRDVLQGKPIKDERIKAMVDPEASAIAGGDYRSLVEAIRDQQKGEDPGHEG